MSCWAVIAQLLVVARSAITCGQHFGSSGFDDPRATRFVATSSVELAALGRALPCGLGGRERRFHLRAGHRRR
jgi:hypothetical protein